MVFWFKDTKTGYGWLGFRAHETFPPDLSLKVDLAVATPYDAFNLFSEFPLRALPKLALCAVDGTDFPPLWRSYMEKCDGIIVMLDHSDFKSKSDKVLGQWFPKLRFDGMSVGQWRPRNKVAGTIMQVHGRKGFNYLPTVLSRLKDWKFEILTDRQTAAYMLVLQRSFPNIEVITNDFSDEELMNWYLSLRVYFSVSMGEGGGLPAFECAYLGVPTLLPYHTAYKFVPNATFYPCMPVPANFPHTGGLLYTPDIDAFVDILNEEAVTDKQVPAPPQFPVEPSWHDLLRKFLDD